MFLLKSRFSQLVQPSSAALQRFLLGLIFLSILFSVVQFYYVKSSLEARDRQRFENRTQVVTNAIDGRLNAYMLALRGGAGIYKANGAFNRKDFTAYAKSIELNRYYPGILGLGFTQRVEEKNLQSFIESQRKDLNKPDFKIWPENVTGDRHSIVFLYPLNERNQAAIGYDMHSDPVRREAMDRAAQTGQPAASGTVTLVQEIDENKQPGFLIYIPVYKNGEMLKSTDRVKNLDGFVYSPFRIYDLFDGLFKSEAFSYVQFQVFDENKELIYQGHNAYPRKPPLFFKDILLPIAGKKWTIRYWSERQEKTFLPWFAFSAGILIVTLAGLAYWLMRIRNELADKAALLKHQEARLKAVIENTPECVKLVAPDGSLLAMNGAGLCMVEADFAKQVIGQNVYDIIAPEYRQAFAAMNARVCSGIKESLEFQIIGLKGTRRFMETHAAPIYDPVTDQRVQLAITRDITQRKRDEQALREKENQLRFVTDHVPVYIAHCDRSCRFLFVNEPYAARFGLKPEQVNGKHIREVLGKDAFESLQPYIERVLEGQVVTFETQVNYNSLGNRWMLVRYVPERGQDGSVQSWVAAIIDITERKYAEEELRRTAEDLRRSNMDLEQFAYVSSHDLQEPLRTITNYIDLLSLRQKDRLDQDGMKYLSYVQEGAHQAQELIRELLGYAQMANRDYPFEWCEFDALLDNALNNLKSSIIENEAEITHDPLPKLKVNGLQITQLLQNLISNAIKYRSRENPKIHISVTHNKGKWIFSVRDNGIGIEPEFQEKVFMIFKRLHSKEHYPGTGIGLALCKKIVQRHGGEIWLESRASKGSVFYFSLPEGYK